MLCLLQVWYIFNVKNEFKLNIIPNGSVTSPPGFSAGATCARIKKTEGAPDLAILYSEVPCQAAAVFTTNIIKAAPVLLDQQKLQKKGHAQVVIINSGCANACTGKQGMQDAETTAYLAGRKFGISSDKVMVASTGVIGVNLPMDKIKEGIGRITLSKTGGHALTQAIMTTDTRPKEIAIKVFCHNQEFTFGGTAKGAGMIHPNMATMLCFITTDASVEGEFLQTALRKAVDESFNMISVDGDTSTNDTVLILANGMAGNPVIRQGSEYVEAFQEALNQICVFLAKAIAGDGEGATRLIEVNVNGAATLSDARLAARTISNSYLVKSAVHGCDPNWGRIAAAAGRSGAVMIEEKTDVYIGDICLFKSGKPLPFDKKLASGLLKCEKVLIRVDLNIGQQSATAWGCDLSEEYVKINSEYTT